MKNSVLTLVLAVVSVLLVGCASKRPMQQQSTSVLKEESVRPFGK